MKILIMNDYLVYGGAEMQSIREKNILEQKGHEVFLLTFDENFPESHELYNVKNNFINIPIKKSFIKKILNVANVNRVNKEILFKIREVIKEIEPDVIHANNLMLDSITQFEAIKEHNVIQTIRDYTAVCPLGTCIKKNGSICSGEAYNNCYVECFGNVRKILKIAAHKKINKERKKIIKRYIAPSNKLTEVCKNNGYSIKCINNPFDFEKFDKFDKQIDFENKIYLYYGAIDENKGVLQLIDAFKEFSGKRKAQLMIAGRVDNSIEKVFNHKISNADNIKYLGKLKYSDMIKVLEKVHTIVVPSIWMENYPNTVLEGLSTETFVIGSNRGGIPEMLENNRGFIFNPNSIDSIKECLIKSYELEKSEYEKIVINNKRYVENNNSFSMYYFKLIQELERFK